MSQNKSDKPTITLRIVGVTYELSGPELSRAIKEAGTSQSEIARLAGHKGAAHICRLAGTRRSTMGNEPTKRIVKALKEAGINVEGFQPTLVESRR